MSLSKVNFLFGKLDYIKQTEKEMKKDIYDLKEDLIILKESYKDVFCEIYGFENEDICYWEGNTLCVGDYFLGFYDVVFAVNEGVSSSTLFNWYDYSLFVYENFMETVSLEDYMAGRLPYKAEDVDKLRGMREKENRLSCSIDELITKMKSDKR